MAQDMSGCRDIDPLVIQADDYSLRRTPRPLSPLRPVQAPRFSPAKGASALANQTCPRTELQDLKLELTAKSFGILVFVSQTEFTKKFSQCDLECDKRLFTYNLPSSNRRQRVLA